MVFENLSLAVKFTNKQTTLNREIGMLSREVSPLTSGRTQDLMRASGSEGFLTEDNDTDQAHTRLLKKKPCKCFGPNFIRSSAGARRHDGTTSTSVEQ